MILTAFVESFKSYFENPLQVIEMERICPMCATRLLTRHGSVFRWVYDVNGLRDQITIFRVRCRPCRFTATLLPSFLLPGIRYMLAVVQAAVSAYLEGEGSYRSVAVMATGVVLPTEQSISDQLTWTSLKPAYQRVHGWVALVTSVAVSSVQDTAAWLVRLAPTSSIIDHLAVPLEPLQTSTRNPDKRAKLDAARLLRHVFTEVRELNPRQRPWMGAWLRCLETIFGRTPWRGPPPSRAVPRGS